MGEGLHHYTLEDFANHRQEGDRPVVSRVRSGFLLVHLHHASLFPYGGPRVFPDTRGEHLSEGPASSLEQWRSTCGLTSSGPDAFLTSTAFRRCSTLSCIISTVVTVWSHSCASWGGGLFGSATVILAENMSVSRCAFSLLLAAVVPSCLVRGGMVSWWLVPCLSLTFKFKFKLIYFHWVVVITQHRFIDRCLHVVQKRNKTWTLC